MLHTQYVYIPHVNSSGTVNVIHVYLYWGGGGGGGGGAFNGIQEEHRSMQWAIIHENTREHLMKYKGSI